MKRVSDLYEPKRVIKDIRRPSAYYSAADVAVSPHTPIGNLTRQLQEKQASESFKVPVRRIKATVRRSPLLKSVPTQPHTTKSPIFPAGFTLGHNSQYVRSRAASSSHKRQAVLTKLRTRTVLGLSAIVGTMKAAGQKIGQQFRQLVTLGHRHVFATSLASATSTSSLLPRRYTAQTGWKVDRERVARWTLPVVLIIAVMTLLVLFLKPAAVPNNNPRTTKARNASASAPAENNVTNASTPGTGSAKSGTNASSGAAAGSSQTNTSVSSGSASRSTWSAPTSSSTTPSASGSTSKSSSTSGSTSSTGTSSGTSLPAVSVPPSPIGGVSLPGATVSF